MTGASSAQTCISAARLHITQSPHDLHGFQPVQSYQKQDSMQPLHSCLSVRLPGCASSWKGPCFTEKKTEVQTEEEAWPRAQKVNDRAMEAMVSFLRTRRWMVTFPTLSSPPPDKHPPSFLSLVTSVSLAHTSLSEAATSIKNNKDFGITLTLEFHTFCGNLNKLCYFSGLIVLILHGILISIYLIEINKKLGGSLA